MDSNTINIVNALQYIAGGLDLIAFAIIFHAVVQLIIKIKGPK